MQLSHVISDSFLTLASLGVLYRCSNQHGHPLAFVWGLFFGSVGLAAFFGVLRFADVHPSMITISQAFQTMASTLGSCGLVAGVCWLFKHYPTWPLITCTVIAGIVSLLVGLRLNEPFYFGILQTTAMVAVLGVSVVYLIKPQLPEHRSIAWRLILAIVLSSLATSALSSLSRPYSIDLFHYLLGAGVLCFGWAAMGHTARGAT